MERFPLLRLVGAVFKDNFYFDRKLSMAIVNINNAYFLPHSLDGNALSQGLEPKLVPSSNSFLVHIQEFSQNLHVFTAKDYAHELLCQMVLEVKEILLPMNEREEKSTNLAPVVACNFPSINLEKLNEKKIFGTHIQGMLMCQFQLKVLEQLLLFCDKQGATNLILMIKDKNLAYLKTYSRFTISEKQVITPKGQYMQIVIPKNAGIYNKVLGSMEQLDKQFRYTLWRRQRYNPAIRGYLRSNS